MLPSRSVMRTNLQRVTRFGIALICLAVVLAAGMALFGGSGPKPKAAPLAPVAPLVFDHHTYKATNRPDDLGVLECWDEQQQHLVKKIRVFRTHYYKFWL